MIATTTNWAVFFGIFGPCLVLGALLLLVLHMLDGPRQ